MNKNNRIKSLLLLVFTIIGFLFPVIRNDPYTLSLLLIIFVFIVAAVGFRLIYITGRLTIGQAAFMGVGAYTSALLSLNFGINPCMVGATDWGHCSRYFSSRHWVYSASGRRSILRYHYPLSGRDIEAILALVEAGNVW